MAQPKEQSVLIKPTAVEDTATDKALQELREAVKQLPKGVLDGAQLIEDVALNITTFSRIAHRLKKRPVGYIYRAKSTPSAVFMIYDDNDNRTDADQFLYLKSLGADVTINLVVF